MITRIGETDTSGLRTSSDIAQCIADQLRDVDDFDEQSGLYPSPNDEEAGGSRQPRIIELRVYRPYLMVSRSKADVLLERGKGEARKGRAQAFRSALGMKK